MTVRKAWIVALLALGCSRSDPTAPAAASTSAPAGPASVRLVPIDAAAPGPSASSSAAGAPPPPDMLLVPGGTFTMGADSGGEEDEHPAHAVALPSFYLDKTEVTNSAWEECVAASVCRPKSDAVRSKHTDFNGPSQPVSGISWDDARAYCAWRGKRLPGEAEFERAARDGDDRRFAWGHDPPTHERTVFSSARTEDVGPHPTGRGPYGHDDLAGNVWEWQADEYDPYAYRRPTAAEGTPGSCAEITAALDEL